VTNSALVLFSAGQDSATCLAWALEQFDEVHTIGFDYGQRHRIELAQRAPVRQKLAALKPRWAARLGGDLVVDISGFGALAESALTQERAFALQADGLPNSFVPGRNLVFFAVAAAHAYRQGLKTMVGGMCETDFSGYPDCRRDTIEAMQHALTLGLGRPTTIETPLMHLTKAKTWALADALGGQSLVDLILEETHTCYRGDRVHRHGWGYGCGVCPACDLRAKGWLDWTDAGVRQ